MTLLAFQRENLETPSQYPKYLLANSFVLLLVGLFSIVYPFKLKDLMLDLGSNSKTRDLTWTQTRRLES